MHLAIDIREAATLKPTGKGVWSRGFLSELLSRDVDLTLLGFEKFSSEWANRRSVKFSSFPSGMRWHFSVASYLRRSKNIDAYISPTSYIVPALLQKIFPCIPIVHDLIAFRGEPHDRRATLVEKLTLRRAVTSAPLVCTVSTSTKDDLLARIPSLSASAITPIFAGPMKEQVTMNEPDGKTILCIATLSPRKNQLRLIEAYSRLPDALRKKYSLILAGHRGWNDGEIVRLARNTTGVEWKEYVDGNEYERLLHRATVFALPSLYEGFGMQILDALQRGIPVLTSDRGSLSEVAGAAALMVDPEDTSSIAAGLDKLLTHPDLRAELRRKAPAQARQFSWRRTVDLFLDSLSGKLS